MVCTVEASAMPEPKAHGSRKLGNRTGNGDEVERVNL